MFWENLPLELRVWILSIRNDMRANAQEMIARCWKKFYAPKQVARFLVSKKFETNWNEIGEYRMNVMMAETANIMEYCAKVLSGRENPHYWKWILEEVEYEMLIYQYNSGSKTLSIYRVEDSFIDLITKFKYGPPGIRHHGRFDGTRLHTIWYN